MYVCIRMPQTFKRYLSAEGLRLGNTYSDRGGKDGYSRKKKRIYILDKVKRETKMEGYKIHIYVTYICSVNQRKGGGW